jgi:chromosome segregation ATPase
VVEDLDSEDFELIIAESPRIEIPIPREKLLSFIKLVEDLGWNKARVKRYITTALKLRELERRYGKSYAALVKAYEKLVSDEVKLRYSIEQLMEKRKQMEEDFKLYMEQYKLTLEAVQGVGKLVEALKMRGLDLADLERALKALSFMKEAGYDVEEIVNRLKNIESYETSIRELEKMIEEMEKNLENLESEKKRLLREIEEIHEISGDLEDLRRAREALEESIKQAEAELNEVSRRLENAKSELETLIGYRASFEEMRRMLDELESEVNRLRAERDSLQNEVAQLLGARNDIGEIRRRLEEERTKLAAIEKEIGDRQSYLEILEGELAAAYSILKLFTEPGGVEVEDLEPLVTHLQRILKIKRGELPALKPLEPHILNKVKDDLASLIMPYVRGEFVPKKAFDQLEKEVKRLREENEALREELESLRKLVEVKPPATPAEQPKPLLEAITPSGEAVELKTLDRGRRFRIKCPSCGEISVAIAPAAEELGELTSKGYKLRFTCRCGKSLIIPPDVLLKKLEASGA